MDDTEELFEIFRSASKSCKNTLFFLGKDTFKSKKTIEKEDNDNGKFLNLIGLPNNKGKKSNTDKVCQYDKESNEILKSEDIYVKLNILEADFFSLTKTCIKTNYEETGFIKLVKKAINVLKYVENDYIFYTILKFFYIVYKILDYDSDKSYLLEYADQKGLIQLVKNFKNYGDQWLGIKNNDTHPVEFTETIHNEIINYYGKIFRKISEFGDYEFTLDRKNKKKVENIISTEKFEKDKKTIERITNYVKKPENIKNIYQLKKVKDSPYVIYNFMGRDYIIYNPHDHIFLKNVSPDSLVSCVTITDKKIGKSANVPYLFYQILKETWEFMQDKNMKNMDGIIKSFINHDYFDLRNHMN